MELQTNVKTGDLKISETSVTPQPQVIGAEKATPKESVQPKKEEDLVTRASKVAIEQPKETKEEQPIFNVNDIEAIEDPKAKEYAQKAYKEFERTYQKKFQELAAIRKDYETTLQKKDDKWTPQKIQSLLSEPEFVQAAQQVIGTTQPSGEAEYSALTESEKRLLRESEETNKQVRMLVERNAQLQKQQQDESLKQRYANYAPDYVDLTVDNLLTGKAQATREDIWKVIDYENAVKRAYELGKQDRQTEQREKMSAVSIEGIEAVNNEDKPTPEKGESDRAFLKRIFLSKLAQNNNIRK